MFLNTFIAWPLYDLQREQKKNAGIYNKYIDLIRLYPCYNDILIQFDFEYYEY